MALVRTNLLIGLLSGLCLFGATLVDVSSNVAGDELSTVFGGDECHRCGLDMCVDDPMCSCYNSGTGSFGDCYTGVFGVWDEPSASGYDYVYIMNSQVCAEEFTCSLPSCQDCTTGQQMFVDVECYYPESECPGT